MIKGIQCTLYNNCTYMHIYTSHKKTAEQNETALSYHRVRRLHFLTVIYAATIIDIHYIIQCQSETSVNIPEKMKVNIITLIILS